MHFIGTWEEWTGTRGRFLATPPAVSECDHSRSSDGQCNLLRCPGYSRKEGFDNETQSKDDK